jgi:hypothetical protein
MSNVVPIRRCGRCGEPCNYRRTIELRGQAMADVVACDACVDLMTSELARVRPVFDAMIACGVDRVIANNTMTFLLNLVQP